MNLIIAEAVVDADGLATATAPRNGIIAEDRSPGPSPDHPSPDHPSAGPVYYYGLRDGPIKAYERTLSVQPLDHDRFRLHQEVRFVIGLSVWSWLFVVPLRHALGRIDTRPGGMPWWAPPQRVDRVGAANLATLCVLSVVIGYLDTLVPQTMTYVGAEYHVGTTGQGVALGVVQVSALVAVVALAVADRQGRRPLALGCVAGGIVLTALGGLAPSLELLVATQVVADGLVGAGYLLVIVVAAEEMPAGGRAWAAGVISLCFGLGGGADLLALPLAGMSVGGWRWLYALALTGLPIVAVCARHLGESRRFVALPAVQARPPGPRRCAASLPSTAGAWRCSGPPPCCTRCFPTPASQYQNQYLRTQRHFSATHISVLSQVAGTIGGLGVLAGGRLADTWGRRPVAVIGVAAGALVTIASYLSGGWALWTWAIMGSLLSYGVGPALSVYGPELFPSGVRSRASGVLGALGAAGGVIGLLAAAGLTALIGTIGPALAILAIGPAAMVALVIVAYPETARRALEQLNPSDQ